MEHTQAKILNLFSDDINTLEQSYAAALVNV